MMNREEQLAAYSRYLELEGQIPDWQLQIEEKNEMLREAKDALHYQKVQLLSAQNPDFLQRLFGKWEAKVEKVQEKVRTAAAECEKLKWDISQLEMMLADGKQEFEQLERNADDYRMLHPLTQAEWHYLAGAAVAEATRCLEDLEAAAPWVRRDASTTRVGSSNRRMEFLARAQAHAERMVALSSLLPEGTMDLGNYLRNPLF